MIAKQLEEQIGFPASSDSVIALIGLLCFFDIRVSSVCLGESPYRFSYFDFAEFRIFFTGTIRFSSAEITASGEKKGHHIDRYVMSRLLEPMGLEPTTC